MKRSLVVAGRRAAKAMLAWLVLCSGVTPGEGTGKATTLTMISAWLNDTPCISCNVPTHA
jgi:hypothetical protein